MEKGLYFRKENSGLLKYAACYKEVERIEAWKWKVLMPDIEDFSILPIIEGKDLVIQNYQEYIEEDRRALRFYEDFLLNPLVFDLNSVGNGVLDWRRQLFSLVNWNFTAKKEESVSLPWFGGSLEFFSEVGGVSLSAIEVDPVLECIFDLNLCKSVSLNKEGVDIVKMSIRRGIRVVLRRMATNHLILSYLTKKEELVKVMSEVKAGARKALVDAGAIVARRGKYERKVVFVLDEKGSSRINFLDIGFDEGNPREVSWRQEELVELEINGRIVDTWTWEGKNRQTTPELKTWAEIAYPFRKKLAEAIGFGDLFEKWVKVSS